MSLSCKCQAPLKFKIKFFWSFHVKLAAAHRTEQAQVSLNRESS